eukprot:818371-Pleurochrysis_carterae.AAC.1
MHEVRRVSRDSRFESRRESERGRARREGVRGTARASESERARDQESERAREREGEGARVRGRGRVRERESEGARERRSERLTGRLRDRPRKKSTQPCARSAMFRYASHGAFKALDAALRANGANCERFVDIRRGQRETTPALAASRAASSHPHKRFHYGFSLCLWHSLARSSAFWDKTTRR